VSTDGFGHRIRGNGRTHSNDMSSSQKSEGTDQESWKPRLFQQVDQLVMRSIEEGTGRLSMQTDQFDLHR